MAAVRWEDGDEGDSGVVVMAYGGGDDDGGRWRRLARIWPDVGGGAGKEKGEGLCALINMGRLFKLVFGDEEEINQEIST
ncbi:hypothetical protein Tco_1362767 [Tanacetum coccineum]